MTGAAKNAAARAAFAEVQKHLLRAESMAVAASVFAEHVSKGREVDALANLHELAAATAEIIATAFEKLGRLESQVLSNGAMS